MATPASRKAVVQRTADYMLAEVARAVAIYRRLYEGWTLNFFFREGDDPTRSMTRVVEGDVTLVPGDLGPDYLGHVRVQGAGLQQRAATVFLSIPRIPLPGELKLTDVSWTPIRRLRWLHGLQPMAYEQLRFAAEMLRKRRAHRRHDRVSLPRGEGSPLFPASGRPQAKKRPAALIGLHWLEVGGAEKLGFDTVEWALEAGLRVFVVASVPSIQRLADRLPAHEDVEFIRLDRYLPHGLWPRYVEALARQENVRLVHIHHCTPLYDSLPQLRATLPGVRVVDSTHIVEYADGGYPRVSGVWSNFIDTHHVISGELVDYFRDEFQVIGKVVLGRMLTRPEGPTALPVPRMQSGQKVLQVAFIGRLYYQKRPVVIAEAFRALAAWARRNGVELRGTIVGEGPFRATVSRLLRRFGLADAVRLLPADADVGEVLRGSDVMLLASNNEGLALVCYEAIADGCIPISTDVGSQKEVVPPDLLVPLAPRAAVRGIVQAVDRLWRDPAFLARQGEEMQRAWRTLAGDPTAREVLMPIYREAAASARDQTE